MSELLLSLPVWAAIALSMGGATVAALAVYFASRLFIPAGGADGLRDAATNVGRVVGTLMSLLLALAFGYDIAHWRTIGDAVDHEAVAVSGAFSGLRLYDAEATEDLRQTLIDYTASVIEDDWPALAQNELGAGGDELLRRLRIGALRLAPTQSAQEELWLHILDDIDSLTDHRLIRLNHALAQTPVYIPVVIFGFLVTIACLGINPPRLSFLVLVSLYASFVGLALYLVVSLSDPFSGGNTVDPAAFERLLRWMQSVEG